MAVVRELLAKFGLTFDDKGSKKFGASVDRQIDGLKKLGGALAVAAGAGALGSFVKEQIAAADAIDKASLKLGVSTDALQEYRHAANLTGVASQTFDVALQRLTRRLEDAKRGAGPAAKAFQQLGIDPRQIKDSEDALNQIADGLAATEDQSARVALSFAFFDSEGVALTNTLQGGSAALADMRQEARDLGGVMDTEVIGASVALTDDLARLDATVQGLKNETLRFLLPVINDVVAFFTRASRTFRSFAKDTKIVQAVFGILATAAAAFFASLILPLLPALAAIAAVVLVVEDLIQLFTGGRSAIGALIDQLFGVGTAKDLVDDLKLAWEVLPGAIGAAVDAVIQFGADFNAAFQAGLQVLAEWWIAFEDLWERAKGAVASFVASWFQFWAEIGAGLAAFIESAVTLWTDFVRALTTFPDAMGIAWDAFVADTLATIDGFVKSATDVWDGFVGALTSFPDAMATAWETFVADSKRALSDLVSNVPDFLKRGAAVLGFEIDTKTGTPDRDQRQRDQRRRQQRAAPRRQPAQAAAQAAARTQTPNRAGRPATPAQAAAQTGRRAPTVRAPDMSVPAAAVSVRSPAASPTVTQNSNTTINVDASRAGDPKEVARQVEDAVRRVNDEERRAAFAALTRQGAASG